MRPVVAARSAASVSKRCCDCCETTLGRQMANSRRSTEYSRLDGKREKAQDHTVLAGRRCVLRDPKVIEHLNIQLTNELTAINQYFLHARTLEHWGVAKLGRREYAESIDEMKHADSLIQRILFLDGLPNVQRLNQIAVGETVEEILRADLRLEEKALDDLREAIAYCESVRDFISRDLLRHILASEEDHVDFIERQFDLIKQIGVERYILLNAAAAPDQETGD
jgi:bacterioferritin